jgi:hypothetical protein
MYISSIEKESEEERGKGEGLACNPNVASKIEWGEREGWVYNNLKHPKLLWSPEGTSPFELIGWRRREKNRREINLKNLRSFCKILEEHHSLSRFWLELMWVNNLTRLSKLNKKIWESPHLWRLQISLQNLWFQRLGLVGFSRHPAADPEKREREEKSSQTHKEEREEGDSNEPSTKWEIFCKR